MEDNVLLVEDTWWKNKKTGETGFITDVQKKKGLIIFRFFQSGHVGSFTNMEFLREFEVLPKSDVKPTIKNIGVTVGSIWRGVKGMEEFNKGRLIKVVYINGSLISWRYLANAAGCPAIKLHRYDTKTTCESSFLYCFEKVQDNDDGAIYRPFDRTHDSEEKPGKYQMVKVVETNVSPTPGGFVFGEIKYVVVPVPADVYSMNLEDFHSEFELFSLNPAKEFCVDSNDPNYSRKLIDPNEGESKMEDKSLSKYHKIAKELRDLAKECDITVGSIWREARGCAKEDVGRLVKVTAISDSGNIIDWVRLGVKPKDMDVLGVDTHGSTCKSSFLYCFERPCDHITTPHEIAWPGTIWYHTNGGVHIGITIKEENGTVSFVSSDNKVLDLYWQMPFKEWIETYKLYNGVDKPPCFPEGSFDEMLEETKGRYERVMERLKEEEKMEANKTETYLKTDTSKLKDFGTGAKREDKTGKGRYDLIPGDVMSELEDFAWETYFNNGSTTCSATDVSKSAYFDDWTDVELYYDFIVNVISYFFAKDHIECTDDCGEISYEVNWDIFRSGLYEMRKQLALHYEAGAVVHGVDNWKKGLPVYGSERGGCFLDSMRRHIDQALMGLTDEPHAVAALWNAFCAVWTLKNKPENITTKPEVEAKSKDREAEYLTLPSGRKIKIEFLRSRTDDEKDNAFLTALLRDKHTAGDIIKALKRVNDAGDASKNMKSDEAPDKIADAPTVSYSVLLANVDNCIELLSKMLVDNSSIDLKFETHEAYINLYMICVLLKSVLCWFYDNDKGRVCIEHLISGIYDLINTNLPSVRHIFENTKAEWVEGYDETYAVCLGNPDKYRVLGMIDLCCRTGMKLMNDDHFCGRTVSNGILFELKEHLSKLIKE